MEPRRKEACHEKARTRHRAGDAGGVHLSQMRHSSGVGLAGRGNEMPPVRTLGDRQKPQKKEDDIMLPVNDDQLRLF